MGRSMVVRVAGAAVVAVLGGALAIPAQAAWRLAGASVTSIAYNQGVAFDQSRGKFFLDGVSAATNSGVYRTDAALRLQAARPFVLPPTAEGYNHAGDLTFDARRRRILLPLECYYPNAGGNTCGTGAFGVVGPVNLRFQYYVNLDRTQIAKAMWAEVSPDGGWIWTSSATRLLAYPSRAVSARMAARQRAGIAAGITGVDLGAVLPGSGVTGAAFSTDLQTGTPRLLLSINLGRSFEVVSYRTTLTPTGIPALVDPNPTVEITMPKTFDDNEPEGLAVTGPVRGSLPLGGVLHWQMLPAIDLWRTILNFTTQ